MKRGLNYDNAVSSRRCIEGPSQVELTGLCEKLEAFPTAVTIKTLSSLDYFLDLLQPLCKDILRFNEQIPFESLRVLVTFCRCLSRGIQDFRPVLYGKFLSASKDLEETHASTMACLLGQLPLATDESQPVIYSAFPGRQAYRRHHGIMTKYLRSLWQGPTPQCPEPVEVFRVPIQTIVLDIAQPPITYCSKKQALCLHKTDVFPALMEQFQAKYCWDTTWPCEKEPEVFEDDSIERVKEASIQSFMASFLETSNVAAKIYCMNCRINLWNLRKSLPCELSTTPVDVVPSTPKNEKYICRGCREPYELKESDDYGEEELPFGSDDALDFDFQFSAIQVSTEVYSHYRDVHGSQEDTREVQETTKESLPSLEGSEGSSSAFEEYIERDSKNPMDWVSKEHRNQFLRLENIEDDAKLRLVYVRVEGLKDLVMKKFGNCYFNDT